MTLSFMCYLQVQRELAVNECAAVKAFATFACNTIYASMYKGCGGSVSSTEYLCHYDERSICEWMGV